MPKPWIVKFQHWTFQSRPKSWIVKVRAIGWIVKSLGNWMDFTIHDFGVDHKVQCPRLLPSTTWVWIVKSNARSLRFTTIYKLERVTFELEFPFWSLSGVCREFFRSPSGVRPEFFRSPSGVRPESVRSPSRVCPESLWSLSGVCPSTSWVELFVMASGSHLKMESQQK